MAACAVCSASQRPALPLQIPFVKEAPLVTFQKPIGSVSVSGHKFVGAPVPCGVVITRMRYIKVSSQHKMHCCRC